ncbi:MAG TPA: hypothetical protein VE821_12355 [Pyrinomonadaceae bacterium]|nr:hypothetical protein [Pyrinomonadaceae bacterium]
MILLGAVLSLVMLVPAWGQSAPTSRAQTSAPATQAKPNATPATTPVPTSAPTQKPAGQSAPADSAAKSKETKGTYQLKISKGQPQLFSLKADHAPVAEIAAELNRRLKVPVLLSPVMQKAHITLEFTTTPLEGALRMIAPQAYIDYEVTGDGALPKVIALYLYALNEPPPSESAVVAGDSQALLIEGNTEDGIDGAADKDAQEKTLNVKIEHNQVTLHARKQPLTVVLGEIANKVDIPFEMKYDSTEVVDVDLSNATMEQVVHTLSPNIRLYQRTDLQTFETRPLRIVLAPPANTQQTTKM